MWRIFTVLLLRCVIISSNAFSPVSGVAKTQAEIGRLLMIVNPNHLIRGDSYGNNSTLPTAAQVAESVGVRPPAEVSPKVWKRAYVTLQYALPLLHALDSLKPPNSSLNLYCMWWKALSGNDQSSPVYDQGLASALLPVTSRWLVRYPGIYPRLHHANVELRTAYLDASVEYLAKLTMPSRRIRLVSFGSGYDVRSIKLRLRGVVDEAVELDLPDVVASKRDLVASSRFRHKLKSLGHNGTNVEPKLVPVDLNDLDGVRIALQDLFRNDSKDKYHTIFLFEAVMIYLNEGIPRALLRLCRSILEEYLSDGSLCFADRLENVPGGDGAIGSVELAKLGWSLIDWRPKPGLARHMGRALSIETTHL